MGFIDKLFGSKKGKKELKPEENKEAKLQENVKVEDIIDENRVEESKNEDVRITDEKQWLLNILKNKISDMKLEVSCDNEKVVIPEIEVSIKAAIKDKNHQGSDVIVRIDFLVENKEFEEEIYESLAGIGRNNNEEEAVNNCIDIFVKTVLNVVIEALKDNHNPILDIETNKKGISRTWHSYVGALQSQGSEGLAQSGNNHYYNLLKDQIVKRLNNKRFYWIKVLITRQINGGIMYQCLLNNKPFLEAERILDEYVKQLPAGNNVIEMQYIIIRQSDKSYNENRQKDIEYENFMKECAEYAISVFGNYGPEDSVEGMVNKIAEFTKDINIAWEFFWFIPAIYCRTVLFGPNYTDTVIMVLPNDKRIFGKLYDYETYVIAVEVVLKKLQENQDQKEIEKILSLSDECKALNKMLKQGSRPEDLQPVPMVLMAPASYAVPD